MIAETLPMSWDKYNKAGECGCVLCGRPLKPNEKRRYIHIGEGGASILHADLPLGGPYGEAAVFADGRVDTGDIGWHEVGAGCAKKLGSGWSKVLPPITVAPSVGFASSVEKAHAEVMRPNDPLPQS